MQRSIYLAKLIGPVFVVIGIGMLVNGAVYRAMASEFLHSHALIYLAGLLALIGRPGDGARPQCLGRATGGSSSPCSAGSRIDRRHLPHPVSAAGRGDRHRHDQPPDAA